MKKGKIIALFILVAIVLAGAVSAYFLYTNGFAGEEKQSKAKLQEIEITEGMSGAEITKLLKNKGIIISETFFRLRMKTYEGKLVFKPGIYSLSSDMTYKQILDEITKYNVKGVVIVTIPEGYKLSQVVELLEKKGLINRDTFMQEVSNGKFNYSFINAGLPQGENRLEGYLFPDTYHFKAEMSEHEIIDIMLKRFNSVYTVGLKARAEELGLSQNEVLTLASIIEKEGKSELDKISSVFHNRLKKGMRLESCATINYLFEEPKDVLSYEDTWIDSPYNTYRNAGLTPAPICSPGEAAIKAALYPADTDYLYFIADGDGNNLFSVTYEEHLEKKGSM